LIVDELIGLGGEGKRVVLVNTPTFAWAYTRTFKDGKRIDPILVPHIQA
jgi:hypothetical protein